MSSYLRLCDVSVEFPIYQGGSRSLKKAILATTTRGNLAHDSHERVVVRALSGINLHIENGQRLGLIGSNGSGKTTLLKTLAGIYEPSRGTMARQGNICSLLDTSVGLNPDISGRENIIFRGMFMGIRPRDMAPYVDEVCEFTELGHYLDMPVRTYSAGMRIRLAFATSTCRVPDILLMDEWLSAGDARFLKKAQERMKRFVTHASLLVLASHSRELLEEWCDRAIVLLEGKIVCDDAVDVAWAEYERVISQRGPAG